LARDSVPVTVTFEPLAALSGAMAVVSFEARLTLYRAMSSEIQ
jgi:hypothetical protein